MSILAKVSDFKYRSDHIVMSIKVLKNIFSPSKIGIHELKYSHSK